ncbi:DUF2894 domain-containing protein [Pseudomonadota bacterium AL_CKDN230030165-1A_HGKHYDSX7]
MTDAHDTPDDAARALPPEPAQADPSDLPPEPAGASTPGQTPDADASAPVACAADGPATVAPPAPRRPLGPDLRRQLADTLERRAQTLEGEARTQLEARVAALRASTADNPASATDALAPDGEAPQNDAPPSPGPLAPDTSPLAQLLAAFAAPGDTRPAEHAAHPGHRYPELPLLDQLRELWSHLSADQQVRHSEALVPDNAGPLNSSHLVHRSLALMRELSPEYLRRFLLYADALSWMEQLDSALTAAREPAAKKGAARSARGGRKPRAG